MAIDRKNQKLIILKSGGPIPELGHISGPVLHPWWVKESVLIQLVNNKRKVFEVNPKNRNEMVQLTAKNVRSNNFENTNTENTAPKNVQQPQVATQPKVTTAEYITPANKQEHKENEQKKLDTSDFIKK